MRSGTWALLAAAAAGLGGTVCARDNFGAARSWNVVYKPNMASASSMLAVGKAVNKLGNGTVDGSLVVAAMDVSLASDLYLNYIDASLSGKFNANASTVQGSLLAQGFAFFLAFGHVFEYNDANGLPGFQADNEAEWNGLNAYYNVRLVQWNPIVCSSQTMGSVQIDSCQSSTGDGVFGLKMTVASGSVEVEGVKLTPEKIKIDVSVNWFNPTTTKNCSQLIACTNRSDAATNPNARLGLTSLLLARGGTFSSMVSGTTRSLAKTVTVQGSDMTGKFDFEDVVKCNGVDVPVVVEAYEDNIPMKVPNRDGIQNIINDAKTKGATVAKFMVFAFDAARPQNCVWDPELGVEFGANPASTLASSPLLAMACLLAMFLALM